MYKRQIFDLTVAIIIGILFSVIMFVLKVSDMTVNVADVDPAKIDIADKDGKLCGTKVVYVTGPLYFGTSNKLSEKLSHLEVDDSFLLREIREVGGHKFILKATLWYSHSCLYFTLVRIH